MKFGFYLICNVLASLLQSSMKDLSSSRVGWWNIMKWLTLSGYILKFSSSSFVRGSTFREVTRTTRRSKFKYCLGIDIIIQTCHIINIDKNHSCLTWPFLTNVKAKEHFFLYYESSEISDIWVIIFVDSELLVPLVFWKMIKRSKIV